MDSRDRMVKNESDGRRFGLVIYTEMTYSYWKIKCSEGLPRLQTVVRVWDLGVMYAGKR